MTDSEQGAGHLVARVMVNRLWQHHFGQGLVATPNDFGVQGSKPTHPELLDWLAAELIRAGWRLKPIHQLIMTSAVYQQAASEAVFRGQGELDGKKASGDGSLTTPSSTDDFARLPQRLSAEAIRDSLLFVAGVLETNMFGPGTLDQASRRRSIYFTMKRSQMIPALQAFDAPEPLVSQGTRQITTVAPQALLLMNNAQVRSWAAAFVKRCAPVPDQPLAKAVLRAYALALNRPPTEQESAEAIAFLEEQISRYPAVPAAEARELALTDFAQVVLSLNEFIYVD